MPASPVHKERKFSADLGAISVKSSKTTRPKGTLLIVRSIKTRGRLEAMVRLKISIFGEFEFEKFFRQTFVYVCVLKCYCWRFTKKAKTAGVLWKNGDDERKAVERK